MAQKNSDIKKMGYREAMAEIERILASLQGGEVDVDTLGQSVGRASALIAECRARLVKAEAEVAKVITEEE